MLRLPFRPLAGFVLLAGLALPAIAAAAEITVVASIKPVHSLIAGVMGGAGSPHLIVRGGASPHSYSLTPSDAAALERAELVVWVGEGLETFLETSIATLAEKAEIMELADLPGLTRLPYRAGGAWADQEAAHDDDHAERHGAFDMHIWLDPDNARVMVAALAAALTRLDPDNSGLYRANAEAVTDGLDQLVAGITQDLAPVKRQPFIVFHDAFQYFDRRFALNNVGSVTVDPERKPGAARLKEIRARIEALGARCVFAEPQFEPRLLQVVIEGSDAKVGVLDPLGADLADGPDLYFELMRRNAAALRACLVDAR